MKKNFQKYLFITLGWICVLLGIIGIVLPLLPTTPFMILALGLFARSSPRFHKMLLDNRYIGKDLQRWEDSKSISKKSKRRAIAITVVTFAISIAVLYQKPALQIMLVGLCAILLTYMWRLKETPS